MTDTNILARRHNALEKEIGNTEAEMAALQSHKSAVEARLYELYCEDAEVRRQLAEAVTGKNNSAPAL